MRYIYKITNKVNGKIYIGQTNDIEKRWKDHLSAVRNNFGFFIHNSIRKRGIDNFVFEVIEECEDIETNDREKFWISHYDSFHNGYNLTSGGDCDFNRCEETILKMSRSKMGHIVTNETREKIGRANSGRVFSEESREKMSKSQMGHEVSHETREKIREKHLGKVVSEETRKKISESKLGKKQSEEVVKNRSKKLKGKRHTEETKKKIGLANSGKKQSEERRQKTREAWARWRLRRQQEILKSEGEHLVPPQDSSKDVTN
jgi:group I intron endonuclease